MNILLTEINQRGGMTIRDVINFEKEQELWFGGRGIIGVLIHKACIGNLKIDHEAGKFKNAVIIPPSVR